MQRNLDAAPALEKKERVRVKKGLDAGRPPVDKKRNGVHEEVLEVISEPVFLKGDRVSCPGKGAGEIVEIVDQETPIGKQRLYKIAFKDSFQWAEFFPTEQAAKRGICLVEDIVEIPKIFQALKTKPQKKLLPAAKNPIARLNAINVLIQSSTLEQKAMLAYELALIPNLSNGLFNIQRDLINELASNIALAEGRKFEQLENEIRALLPQPPKAKRNGKKGGEADAV